MDANGRPSIIKLKTSGEYQEGRAAGAITPGHLIKLNSSAALVVHDVVGGQCQAMFATEEVQTFVGKTKDDAYASGDVVSYITAIPGDEIQAFLKDGESVVIGDKLVSGGNGSLIKMVSPPPTTPPAQQAVLAEALEALDLTGVEITTDQRINIRVL